MIFSQWKYINLLADVVVVVVGVGRGVGVAVLVHWSLLQMSDCFMFPIIYLHKLWYFRSMQSKKAWLLCTIDIHSLMEDDFSFYSWHRRLCTYFPAFYSSLGCGYYAVIYCTTHLMILKPYRLYSSLAILFSFRIEHLSRLFFTANYIAQYAHCTMGQREISTRRTKTIVNKLRLTL